MAARMWVAFATPLAADAGVSVADAGCVQRSSVILVARKLQEAGLIRYRRGRIQVIDIEGLHDSCCECYGAINGHFSKLIGWSPDVTAHNPATHKTDSPPL